MLTKSYSHSGQQYLFHNELLPQLDVKDPLIQLADVIDWSVFETAFAKQNRTEPITTAVCDRGYRGLSKVGGTEVILPKKPLKKDNRYQRDKKRKLCKRRAAIEPLIGHLKSDFRLSRNFLKSSRR